MGKKVEPGWRTHGATGTPEHRAWLHMRERCLDAGDPNWKNYGGRGIAICQRWQRSFREFFADMGPRPTPKHTLDRIDNNGPYSPENCKWSTRREQQRNRRCTIRCTHDGRTLTLSEWSEIVGINRRALHMRINRMGWPPDRAFTEPVRPRRSVRRVHRADQKG